MDKSVLESTADEVILLTNGFGTITSKRVVFSNGGISDYRDETIYLKHISNISFQQKRYIMLGIVLTLLALLCVSCYEPGNYALIIFALILICGAIIAFIGKRYICIQASSGYMKFITSKITATYDIVNFMKTLKDAIAKL